MTDKTVRRLRRSDPDWPSDTDWQRLSDMVDGRLAKVADPFAALEDQAQRDAFFQRQLKNPYFIGRHPGLTQTLGWTGAWTTRPSVYALEPMTVLDIKAGVDFAREHRLRLVVRGGGHSYKGTSNAPDSLMIWTRRMKEITVDEAFVPEGCAHLDPTPAVSFGAGALWGEVYAAVTTQGGRYVQGGGCLSVGACGLVQAGGFGSFSKRFGLAAASLLEAEIVTADGEVRIANPKLNPDLFWVLKGGGGGSFGVVSRMTLRTHELPRTFGRLSARIRAASPAAFQDLVLRTLEFYRDHLFNPGWGEQIGFLKGNVLVLNLAFCDLGRSEAESLWRPFLAAIEQRPDQFAIIEPPRFAAFPARGYWDPKARPEAFLADDEATIPGTNLFWIGNQQEAGMVLHDYHSRWIPAALLKDATLTQLAAAVVEAASHWDIVFHFNKGLAGATDRARREALETAINPAVVDAFALMICASGEQSGYPGIASYEPDTALAAERTEAIGRAMACLSRVAPDPACYLAESAYRIEDWQHAFWSTNYDRLLAIKTAHDPEGLFHVHHGVGSERWRDGD